MAFLEDKLQISLKKGLGMSEIYSWVSEIFDVIYLFTAPNRISPITGWGTQNIIFKSMGGPINSNNLKFVLSYYPLKHNYKLQRMCKLS